jgi:hypothetical protein
MTCGTFRSRAMTGQLLFERAWMDHRLTPLTTVRTLVPPIVQWTKLEITSVGALLARVT